MSFKIANQTLGSDFEMGVFTSDGVVTPVTNKLGGTKETPIYIGNGCYKQEDGPMAEFNIPPAATAEQWSNSIEYCMDVGNDELAKSNLTMRAMSSAMYTDEDLDSNDLRTLGCSQSNDPYTEDITAPDGNTTNMRTCGFHVHVGFSKKDENGTRFKFADANYLAKCFDLEVGLPCLLLDPDNMRRNLYGQAGDFRVNTTYDEANNKIQLFEYRSLGGNLLQSKEHIQLVYTLTQKAVARFNSRLDFSEDEIAIRDCINNSDVETAKQLIQKYKEL